MRRSFGRVSGLAILAVLIAAFAPAPERGVAGVARIFVDQSAAGANNGTTWADAYTDLSTALAAAANAELWVAAGVYVPGPARTDTFTLNSGIAIYGGFAGGETALTQRDPALNLTVLSGDTGTPGQASDNAYHVVTAPGDATAILDGFVVTGGFADGANPADDGAGIYAATGSPTIRNTVVRGNRAAGAGGGMLIDTGNPTISGVVFEGNSAGAGGGGVAVITGQTSIDDTVFRSNAGLTGGGLFFGGTNLVVTDSTFAGNHASIAGGAFVTTGTVSIERTLFQGNASDSGAAGLDVNAASTTLRNSTFYGNRGNIGGAIRVGTVLNASFVTVVHNSAGTGGGIWAGGGGNGVLGSSIISQNTPNDVEADNAADTVTDSIVGGGCPANATCTNVSAADPKLGALVQNGGPSKTMAPLPGSPAIDALPVAASCATVDQRGVARPVDGDKDGQKQCDLGAYEYAPAGPLVQFATVTSKGAEGSGTLKLDVKLNTTSGSPITVKYAVSGGTASGKGKDYTLAAGTLTFPKGATTRTINVALVGDRLDEKNETIEVKLSVPTGATLGPRTTHTATILDDDPRRACRGRVATIVGTDGKDDITGTNGPDVVVALGGNDIIDGGGGDDVICAGPGADQVNGGRGNDALLGQGDNDRLGGDGGADLLFGGGGNDTLTGGPSAGDACVGGPGTDVLGAASGCESKSGVP